MMPVLPKGRRGENPGIIILFSRDRLWGYLTSTILPEEIPVSLTR